jgi:hypothetical protein
MTIEDCKIVDLPKIQDPRGNLTFIEGNRHVPFACGEWGRWIVKPGSLAAVESAWLIYRCAFEQLKLLRVYCRTAAENKKVVSFHDSCGITDRRILAGHFELNGRRMDAIEHQLASQTWSEIGPRLEKMAQLIARRLQDAGPDERDGLSR